jgi:hypothetical protein
MMELLELGCLAIESLSETLRLELDRHGMVGAAENRAYRGLHERGVGELRKIPVGWA